MAFFLRNLIRQAVRKVAQDPRVRETAKRVFEEEVKPRAKSAWEQAKPEVEAAWEKAKPEVEAAREKLKARAVDFTDRVRKEIHVEKKPDKKNSRE